MMSTAGLTPALSTSGLEWEAALLINRLYRIAVLVAELGGGRPRL